MAETQQDETQSEEAEAADLLADALNGESREDSSGQFDERRAREALSKKNAEAANLRKRLKELEPLAQRARELEDAQKTEMEKLTEQLQAATADGSTSKQELLRLSVALTKAPEGMAPAKIASLAARLRGGTQEELEEDADALFAEFAPQADSPKDPAQRPREDLRAVPLDVSDKATKTDMNTWMRTRSSAE